MADMIYLVTIKGVASKIAIFAWDHIHYQDQLRQFMKEEGINVPEKYISYEKMTPEEYRRRRP